MYTVKLIPKAQAEFADACIWYEEKQIGLGVRFFKAVSSKFSSIELNPFHYAVRFSETFRFANVRDFPYTIGYKVDENDGIIYVMSVFHTSKNPYKF